jgi:hypothetical protein
MGRRSCRSGRSGRAFALALLAVGSLTASAAASAEEQVAAVLKSREVSFIYHSVVNIFACDELRSAVATILRALGARDDVQVRINECEVFVFSDDTSPSWDRSRRTYDPAARFRSQRGEQRQNSPVHIQLMFPTEATPDVMAEIDKDKSRRELVSRVTGNPLFALNDAIIFPAERRQVTLSQKTIRLRPEHCELLEQMVTGVFRTLDVKVIRKQLACPSDEVSHFYPKVTVEVLWPVGTPLPGEGKKK